MKKIKLLYLLLFTLGTTFVNFGQEVEIIEEVEQIEEVREIEEVEEEKVVKEEKKEVKKIEHKPLKISVEIFDNWRVKNSKRSKSLHLKNNVNDCQIKIFSMNQAKALGKIFESEDKKDFQKELDEIFKSIKSKENVTLNYQFSTSQSKIEKGYMFYTCYKVINKQSFLIEVKAKQDCTDCEKSYEEVIDSMTILQ